MLAEAASARAPATKTTLGELKSGSMVRCCVHELLRATDADNSAYACGAGMCVVQITCVKNRPIESSQAKSAPTPAGEPNVRAEAENRKIYIQQKMPNPVQPTSVSHRTSKK